MAKVETTLSPAHVAIAEALFAQRFVVTVGKKAKTPTSREIPFAEFPANSVLAIVNYGVQRKFNDAVGGSDMSIADKLEAIDEMIESYRAGDIGRARAAGRSALDSEIISVMRGLYKEQVDANTYKVESNSDDFEDAMLALFAEQNEAGQAAIREAAEGVLAAKAAAKAAKAGLKLGTLGKLSK